MSFDSFDDSNFDLKKILEQLAKQMENMPGPLGQMMKELMKQLENMNPEQLNEMFHNMLKGEKMPFDLQNLGDDFMKGGFNFFNFAANPEMMSKIQDMLQNNPNFNVDVKVKEVVKVEEPYYEFLDDPETEEGQLLIELPGINDLRNIIWDLTEGVFSLNTINDSQKYKLEINLPKPLAVKDALATLNNGVLTLPYKYN